MDSVKIRLDVYALSRSRDIPLAYSDNFHIVHLHIYAVPVAVILHVLDGSLQGIFLAPAMQNHVLRADSQEQTAGFVAGGQS